jgi:amino acid permease
LLNVCELEVPQLDLQRTATSLPKFPNFLTMSESKDFKTGPSVDTTPTVGSNEDVAQGSVADITSGSQSLHRSLRGKEVQLFAIGGAIGTCMF